MRQRIMRAPRADYDIGYGLFLFSGLVALFVGALGSIPMGTGTAGGVGMFVALPLYVGSLLAMLTGIGFAFRLRDELGLVILSGLAILFMANFFTEAVPAPVANYVPVGYGAVVVTVCCVWFFRGRSRFPS